MDLGRDGLLPAALSKIQPMPPGDHLHAAIVSLPNLDGRDTAPVKRAAQGLNNTLGISIRLELGNVFRQRQLSKGQLNDGIASDRVLL